jgi:membrane protease YdiL (CAAX protease family)
VYERPSFLQVLGKVLKIWWIVVLCVSVAYDSIKDLSWMKAYANIDWSLLGLEAIGIVFVLLLAFGIYRIHPGIMGFGLVRVIKSLIGNKPKRNDDETPEMEGGNIGLMVTDIKYVGIVVCLLLLIGLPRCVAVEEELFRQGTIDWWDGIVRSLAFGFAHMLVGVPVAGAITISIVGMFFTYMYFMGGVDLSTQAHFQYNLILVSLLLFGAIGKSFARD